MIYKKVFSIEILSKGNCSDADMEALRQEIETAILNSKHLPKNALVDVQEQPVFTSPQPLQTWPDKQPFPPSPWIVTCSAAQGDQSK